jgi:magnesium transporter
VDAFFPILERYGDLAEALEARVIAAPDPGLVAEIHLLKRELLDVRRALWPQREAINALLHEGEAMIPPEVRPYLRDCADHCFQLMDMVEVDREIAQGLIDLHLSSVSNRMNAVMKVLTIISTFFMPMTFMAGLWGMNFDRASPWNMPELGWTYGYPVALGAMALSGAALVAVFWRIGWIRFPRRGDDTPGG